MRRTVLVTILAALIVSPPGLRGADTAHPDFSGTWHMDPARSESANSGAPSGPVTVVIKQSANEVSIETRQGEQTETLVYKLDGTESEKPAQDNGPVPMEGFMGWPETDHRDQPQYQSLDSDDSRGANFGRQGEGNDGGPDADGSAWVYDARRQELLIR